MPANTCDCCGQGCGICSDDFNRSDGTDIDTGSSCGWTETSGSWSISSNTLRTSSSSAKATCTTTHPDGSASHYVSVVVYGSNTDELRVHTGTTHFAQVTIGDPNGCLSLYDGATLLTRIRVDAAASTNHTLKVWYGLTSEGDSQFAAQLNSGTVLRYNVTRAGTGVGLGTGTVSGEVRFDDFVYEKHYATSTASSCKETLADCSILTDSFTRADSSDIGCLWDEVSGAWSISGNKLRVAATSAVAECQCVHPQNVGAIAVTVTFRSSAADKVRVYTDTTANNYAEYDINADTVKIYLAGVLCESLSYTMAVNTDYTTTVVQSKNLISVSISGGASESCFACRSETPAAATYVALGTGNVVGGNVDFDNFELERGYDSNNTNCQRPCTTCDMCGDGDFVSALVIRFDNISDGTCADCDTLVDGVEFEVPFFAMVAGSCTFSLYLPGFLCGNDMQIDVTVGASLEILVSEIGATERQFLEVLSGAINCDTDFPWEIAATAFGTSTVCLDDATTTATIVELVR